MAVFTTETRVREKFQMNDLEHVPSTLVVESIDDAHGELLRFLDPAFAAGTPEDALVMGETLLAGAHVHRSLASKAALEQRRVAVGGQRIEESGKAATLLALAQIVEEQAWYLLEPYLTARPDMAVGATTDTTPVLGED
jgi:hypothetical protein